MDEQPQGWSDWCEARPRMELPAGYERRVLELPDTGERRRGDDAERAFDDRDEQLEGELTG